MRMNNRPITAVMAAIEQRGRGLVACYQSQGHDIQEVLVRGSADFDVPHNGEDALCRAWAYAGHYMRMHYEANVEVYTELCRDHGWADRLKRMPVLFIDYGCGPMTSGIALLAALGKTHSTESIAYLGVDVSKNMLSVAREINAEHGLFAQHITCQNFTSPIATNVATICYLERNVIISFSYVLATITLKGKMEKFVDEVVQLASAVLENHRRIIYVMCVNPKGGHMMVSNWEQLCCRLNDEFGFSQIMEGDRVYGRKNPLYCDVIMLSKR